MRKKKEIHFELVSLCDGDYMITSSVVKKMEQYKMYRAFTSSLGSNSFEIGLYTYYRGKSNASYRAAFKAPKGIFINYHRLISAKERASKEAPHIQSRMERRDRITSIHSHTNVNKHTACALAVSVIPQGTNANFLIKKRKSSHL